jgi:glycogen debranching enzyme
MQVREKQRGRKLPSSIKAAYRLLRSAIITFEGRPVGTAAAVTADLPAENYGECFIRDFMPSGLVCLIDGDYEIVRNFLRTVLLLRNEQREIAGHSRLPGVLPASFHVTKDTKGGERLVPDFGDRAIGRVAPVDSMMLWVALLARYAEATGDIELAQEPLFQEALQSILELVMRDSYEVYPTLLTPDGCFMIDRRMGVYGHPLEVQALFYGLLKALRYLLAPGAENSETLRLVRERGIVLRDFVRRVYWLDLQRLNEIHRFRTEEFGAEAANELNLYPESIPDWVVNWLPAKGGYLAGNIGPSRLDFRFFALGNLIAIITGLASKQMAEEIFSLYEARWSDLIGLMPVKICYPALEGLEWSLMTGCDPKNVPWSYHNAGNWPALLHVFTAAAIRAGREDLARRAFAIAEAQLAQDGWPEYYDGRAGRLIGRRAAFNQVWSATSLITSYRLLEDPTVFSRIYLPSIEEEL